MRGSTRIAGALLVLSSCHWCPDERDCDRWHRFEHDLPLRAADYAVAVGPGGTLAVAEEKPAFPFFHYARRDSGTDVDLLAAHALALSDEPCPFVVVGERGTIRISDDGGASWRAPGSPPTTAALRAVDGTCPVFTGVAVGDGGTVLVARDDVETWEARDVGTTRSLRAVAVFDETALAVGDGGIAVRSVDGGDTWAPVAVPTDADLLAVSLSAGLGMIGAVDGALLASRDDGATWSRIELEFDEPIRQLWAGLYDAGTDELEMSAFFRGDSGMWAWFGDDGRLELMYPLNLKVHAFAYGGALGGRVEHTALIDGATLVYKWCTGCD